MWRQVPLETRAWIGFLRFRLRRPSFHNRAGSGPGSLMAAASAAASTLAAIIPVTPSSICSINPPTGLATTGTPWPRARLATPDWLASVCEVRPHGIALEPQVFRLLQANGSPLPPASAEALAHVTEIAFPKYTQHNVHSVASQRLDGLNEHLKAFVGENAAQKEQPEWLTWGGKSWRADRIQVAARVERGCELGEAR